MIVNGCEQVPNSLTNMWSHVNTCGFQWKNTIWLELGGALEALVSHDDRCDPCFFLRRSAYYIKHHLKKKLPSVWGTPYLVTKLRIKSEHFSANPDQSYLTPMTTFHHPKGMQLFNVVQFICPAKTEENV